MPTDRYTKIVLTLIAMLLAVIAFKPLLHPTPSYAAHPTQYKVVETPQLWRGGWRPEQKAAVMAQATQILNGWAKDGWEVQALPSDYWILQQP